MSNASSDDESLPFVPNVGLRALIDSSGQTRGLDVVNLDPTGPQSRFYSVHQGSTVMRSNRDEDIAAAVAAAFGNMQEGPASDTGTIVADEAVPQTATDEERVTDEDGASAVCAGCNSRTHTLAECFRAWPNGYMHGCPRCNTLEHGVDDCEAMREMSLKDKLQYLVWDRGNMPPFASSLGWGTLLQQYVSEGPGPSMPSYFPWTPQFTSVMGSQATIVALQRVFDESRDRGQLPVDPATRNWEAAQVSL